MWDLLHFDCMSTKGPFFRRLGHIEEMRAAAAAGTEEEPVVKKLERVGDVDFTVPSAPATHRERLIADHYRSHMMYWPC